MKNKMLLILNITLSLGAFVLVIGAIQASMIINNPSSSEFGVLFAKISIYIFMIVMLFIIPVLFIVWRAYLKSKFKLLIVVGILWSLCGLIIIIYGYEAQLFGSLISIVGILYLYIAIKEIKITKRTINKEIDELS